MRVTHPIGTVASINNGVQVPNSVQNAINNQFAGGGAGEAGGGTRGAYFKTYEMFERLSRREQKLEQ